MALPAQSERPQGEINTLLGRGSEFEGKLTFEGTVRIDGKLSGEIFSEDVLVVGEGATVNAEIDVGVIIVEGNVTGNIRAKRAVELHAPARVKGNIETPSLRAATPCPPPPPDPRAYAAGRATPPPARCPPSWRSPRR